MEMKTSEEYIGVDLDGALSCYHGVLRSIRGIAKLTDERNAGHASTMTQLRLLLRNGRKVKVVLSTAGSMRKRHRFADLESVIEAKGLELQSSSDFASERSTLRADASSLMGSIETLGRKKRKMFMITQKV